jgi:tetratricopeptide (TPR) repeat protein
MGKVTAELDKISKEVIDLIDNKLLSQAEGDKEALVFYHKMKADYYRYISEYASEERKKEVIEKSKKSYTDAVEVADKLITTHPIRLGLHLNFSVFHYECMNDPKKAIECAKSAFDKAIADIEDIAEDNYKDSTTIM